MAILTQAQMQEYNLTSSEAVDGWVQEFGKYFFDQTTTKINERTGANINFAMPEIRIVEPRTRDEELELRKIDRTREKIISKMSDRHENGEIDTDNAQAELELLLADYDAEVSDRRHFLTRERISRDSGGTTTANKSENIVRLNKTRFNPETLAFTSLAHELLHRVRIQSSPTEENMLGYFGFGDIYDDLEARGIEGIVPPYLIEFFAELNPIILSEMLPNSKYSQLLDNLKSDYHYSLEDLITAQEFFNEGGLDNFSQVYSDLIKLGARLENTVNSANENEIILRVGQQKIKYNLQKIVSNLEAISKTNHLTYLTFYSSSAATWIEDNLKIITYYANEIIHATAVAYRRELNKKDKLDLIETFVAPICELKSHDSNSILDELGISIDTTKPYKQTSIIIQDNKEALEKEWPQVFLMPSKEVDEKYCKPVLDKISITTNPQRYWECKFEEVVYEHFDNLDEKHIILQLEEKIDAGEELSDAEKRDYLQETTSILDELGLQFQMDNTSNYLPSAISSKKDELLQYTLEEIAES